MISKKLFTVLLLGVAGTLIVIGATKFLPIQKSLQNSQSLENNGPEKSVPEIKDVKQLKKIIQSDNPIIIKFHAHWCGACNYVKGPFTQISKELTHIHFYEVNVDNQDVMNYVDEHKIAKDGVEALPSFVLRQGNKVNEQFVGGMNKDKLTQKIKNAFS